MCAFEFFFGFDCPGCGLTHAVLLLLRGEVLESIRLHPMGVVVVLWVAGFRWIFRLGDVARQWISHGVLAGVFVPWLFRFFI